MTAEKARYAEVFGSIKLTEPVTLKDIAHTAAYGDYAILHLVAALFRDLGWTRISDDERIAYQQIKNCQKLQRVYGVYCTRTEVDAGYSLRDVEFALHYNILDTKWEYEKVDHHKFEVLNWYGEHMSELLRLIRKDSSFEPIIEQSETISPLFDDGVVMASTEENCTLLDEKFYCGFGTLLPTEGTKIGDIIVASAYGGDEIQQWCVDLLRTLPGYEIPDDNYRARGSIQNCRGTHRIAGVYKAFYSEDAYSEKDVLNVLEELLRDAADYYRNIDEGIQKTLINEGKLFRARIEHLRTLDYLSPVGRPSMSLKEINYEISKRTEYGRRFEVAKGEGHILIWSNASERWLLSTTKVFIGSEVNLDANEVFIVGSYSEIDAMLDDLYPLPLYTNSMEFRARTGAY